MSQRGGRISLGVVAILIFMSGFSHARQQKPVREELINTIRQSLASLPYYGVFDHLVFELEGDDVTLGGYAYQSTLKRSAEREVAKIEGVAKVDNQIEVLPVSTNDDRIRMSVFRAIYRAPGLARYGFGGETWRAFSQHEHELLYFRREPLGTYPIHIIVKHGNVILVGLVAREEDKNLAGIKANGVSGVFSVTNNLKVDNKLEQP